MELLWYVQSDAALCLYRTIGGCLIVSVFISSFCHGSEGGKARCGESPTPSSLGGLRRHLSPKQGKRLVA